MKTLTGMETARELLRSLSKRIPPPIGQHHALMLPDDDNGGLSLVLRIGGEGLIANLDRADLVRDHALLVEEIVTHVTKSSHPTI